MDGKRIVTETEVCRMYGLCHNTVRKYFGKASFKVGRCRRYDLEQIRRMSNDKETQEGNRRNG